MVQKLHSSTGAFGRSALVLVGWVFFVLAQVMPEPGLKLVFALIARVLPNALARRIDCAVTGVRTTQSPVGGRVAGCALA
jgi:hypothetical protein